MDLRQRLGGGALLLQHGDGRVTIGRGTSERDHGADAGGGGADDGIPAQYRRLAFVRAEGGLTVHGAGEALGAPVVGRTFRNEAGGVGGERISLHLGQRIQVGRDGGAQIGVERRQVRGEAVNDPADNGDDGLEALLPGRGRPHERQVSEMPEIQRRDGMLNRGGRVLLPEVDEAQREVGQQVGDGGCGGDRAFHGEGIDDLRRGGGVFGIHPVEETQHIAKEGIGGVHGEPSGEGGQRAVVRGRLGERQADRPAH